MTSPSPATERGIPHLADTPVLQTERLVLRAPVLADWPVFLAFMQSERSTFLRGAAFSQAKAWRDFGNIVGHWALRGFGMFTVTDQTSGAALGVVGNWSPEGRPEREIGWVLWDPAAEGRGIAHEAAVAVLAHTFGALGWQTAVSYISSGNRRSIALAERLGARLDPDAAKPEFEALVFRHARAAA